MGPAVSTWPCFKSIKWEKPSGISSTWCVTRTIGGVPLSRARVRSRLESPLATAHVESRERLVEQQELGLGHEGARQ